MRLDRIYTRGGDKGMTSLGDGTRVPKTHPRIAAYGTVDELNSVLGVVLLQSGFTVRQRALLRRIQNDLFDVGADLCVPRTRAEAEGARLRITPAQAQQLETEIDAATADLQPLTSFVLPGGRPAAAWLHVARVVCRRAELLVARLLEMESEAVGAQVLVYLNRLSDLLFVLARVMNDGGRADVLWRPGASRAESVATTPVRRRTRTAPAPVAPPAATRRTASRRDPRRGARTSRSAAAKKPRSR